MNHFKKLLMGGAVILSMAGCMESGISSDDSAEASDTDPALSALASMGIHDGENGMVPGAEFADELGLSDDQKARIKAAVDSLCHSLRPHGKPGGEPPDFAEMQAKGKAMRDSIWTVIMSFLDADQQAKASAIRADIESGARPSPQTLAEVKRLTEKLGLDSAQQEKITVILAETQANRKAAEDAATSFEDLRARMDALRAGTDARIQAELTESQAAIFATLKRARPGPGLRHHGRGPGRHGQGRHHR